MKNHTKALLAALAACTVVVAKTANAATILESDPLNVAGLTEGDSFQLVFATRSTTRRTTEPDGPDAATVVAFWDGLVNTAADGSTITGLGGLEWKAIVSITTEDAVSPETLNARDHAVVSGLVYNLNGAKVADDAADMWDGSIDNPINYDEDGDVFAVSGQARFVWTGSLSDGTAHPAHPLGNSGEALRGNVLDSDGGWLNDGSSQRRSPGDTNYVYGLSEVITIVPEPGSLALLGLGGVLIVPRRRRG
ncbi:MAG: PEP-CTERM sorting domain-containing protein [Planctomycetota bacterium]